MAEHADAAELNQTVETEETNPTVPKGRRLAGSGLVVAVAAVMVVAVGSLAAWLGYGVYQNNRANAEREQLVQAARQSVINLTTMNHNTIDADITRILDSTTGAFHDDFQARSQPFAEVVRQAKSTSEGTVTSAAIAEQDGDAAQVLLTVSVKMSNDGAPEQPPRSWRMKVEVLKIGDRAKVSNVQFVA